MPNYLFSAGFTADGLRLIRVNGKYPGREATQQTVA
jgi:hypothetical protein